MFPKPGPRPAGGAALRIYNKAIVPMFWALDIILDSISIAATEGIVDQVKSEAKRGIVIDHINGRAAGLCDPRNLQRMAARENSAKGSQHQDRRSEAKKAKWRIIMNALHNLNDFQE